jgi:uncharacterized integral membrane protein
MIRLIVIVILFGAALLFALENSGQQVSIWYFFGRPPLVVALHVLLLAAFIAGMGIALLLLFPEWIRLRMDLRRHRKILTKVEDELAQMRGGGRAAPRPAPTDAPDETEY